MSRISRGFRINPYGGIGDTGLLRSAMSVLAMRRSTGGVPSRRTTCVGVSSRSVPTTLSPLRSVRLDRPEPRRDARARLEQRLDELVAREGRADLRQRRPDVRAFHRVAAGALRGGVAHDRLDAALRVATGAQGRPQRQGQRFRRTALAERVEPRDKGREPVGLGRVDEIDLNFRRNLARLRTRRGTAPGARATRRCGACRAPRTRPAARRATRT